MKGETVTIESQLERVEAAEKVAAKIVRGELPHLEKLVFRARFRLRAVGNAKEFERISDGDLREPLHEASEAGAYIQLNIEDGHLSPTLYHGRLRSREQSLLYARALVEVSMMTLTALGLDVGHASSRDSEESS